MAHQVTNPLSKLVTDAPAPQEPPRKTSSGIGSSHSSIAPAPAQAPAGPPIQVIQAWAEPEDSPVRRGSEERRHRQVFTRKELGLPEVEKKGAT